jgi:hypothetical protein
MRAGLWAIALAFLAGCGSDAPPQPPPEAASARAAAEEWRREGPEEGVHADAADRALARAERLLSDGTPDAAVFREAEASYRDAIARARAARDARQEKLYREALDARSAARALRRRLDERRTTIETTAAAPGREGAFWAAVRDLASAQVFGSDAMLATDAALEKAEVLFADGLHEEARETFAKAAADLEALLADVAAAEGEARGRSALAEAERAVAAMRARVGGKPPPPAFLAEAALDAARRAVDQRDFARVSERAGEAERLSTKAMRHGEEVAAAAVERAAALKARDEWARTGAAETELTRAARAKLSEGEVELEADPAAASAAFEAAASSFIAALEAERQAFRERLKELRRKTAPPPLPPDPLDSQKAAEGVRLALEWLSRHQDDDGRWSCSDFMRHDPLGPPRADGGNPNYDAGVTGLALLCFLEAGYSDRGEGERGYYNINVEQGLRWLRSVQSGDGVYGPRVTQHFIYCHAIATIAMSEASRRSKDPQLKKSAELAVRYIEHARNRNLAWRYEPRGGENDTSVTVWCVEALAAAQAAGIDVDAAAWRGALAWVDSATGEFGRVGYDTRGGLPSRPEDAQARFPPERSESMTAAGILVRVLAREIPRKEDLVACGVKLIMDQPPTWVPDSGTIDMYYWRCATRALRLVGSGEWPKWKGLVQPVCLRWQVPASGAHNAGSWDPVDVWGQDGGRVYATAMMTLALIESARAAP